jgi:hypothetical protein
MEVGIQFTEPESLARAMDTIRCDDMLRTRCLRTKDFPGEGEESEMGPGGQGQPDTHVSFPRLDDPATQELLVRMIYSDSFSAFVEELGSVLDGMSACLPGVSQQTDTANDTHSIGHGGSTTTAASSRLERERASSYFAPMSTPYRP